MKKILLLTIAIIVACSTAIAAPVDATSAQSKAQHYLASKVYAGKYMAPGATQAKLILSQMGDKATTPVFYIFNTATTFVIVSGDDRAEEILAVGDKPLNLDRIPCNMQAWLYNYKHQLDWLLTHPDVKVDKPTAVKSPKVDDNRVYGPLMTAIWDQDAPFNDQCYFDYNGTTYECYTGCPATSASMILYYWKFPTGEVGPIPSYSSTLDLGNWNSVSYTYPALPAVTFDWNNMLDDYTGGYTPEQGAAVATLMRYVGQCEHMMYGTTEAGGSGIYTTDTQIIADMYIGFGYDETTCRLVRKSDYSEQEWAAMLQEEIIESRPVVFCGVDNGGAGGHAFNVDGYDPVLNKYHVNFGWSGDGNNWYAMNAFGYSSYTFSDNQRMVLGIQPPRGTIFASPRDVNFEGFDGETYTTTINVRATYLDSDISLELSGSSDFSIDATTITPEQATTGYDVTITYAPSAAGNSEATLTLSCADDEVLPVTVPITAMARPRVPTLLVEPQSLSFGASLEMSVTKSLSITGAFLTGDVTLSVNDVNGVFTTSQATIAQSSTDVNTPVQVDVTFNSPVEGTFTGQLVIASEGAQPVNVELIATASAGGTASDPFLDLANYESIDEAGWNTDDIMNLYRYTEYGDTAWLTVSNYGVMKADATQNWFTNSGTRFGSATWLANDVFLGSPNYFNGTPYYADWSEDYQTFFVTNCTQVKQYALNKGSSYPLVMTIFECERNADGSITAATTPIETVQSSIYNIPEIISSSPLDATKIYKVAIYNDYSNLYEIGFQRPIYHVPAPVATQSTQVSATGFVANWNPVPNATSYTLRVMQKPTYISFLTETFAGCTTTGSTDIGNNLDNYLDNSGWTGSKVYSAIGGLRLGTGSATGSLTSPAIDLSQSGGKVSAVINVKTLNKDTNCELKIACGDVDTTVVVPDSTLTRMVVILNCATEPGQQLSFTTTAKSKRVVFSSIELCSGEYNGDKSTIDAAPSTIVGITSCNYAVTGLSPATNYIYDVKALIDKNDSKWSNIIEVLTLDSSAVVAGDVNGDGEVNATDVTVLYNFLLLGDNSALVNGDQDSDGEITVGDITTIYNILLGAK